MSTGIVQLIKQAAMDAVAQGKPADLRYGTIISTSPLNVKITNTFILPSSMLVVPQHLTDYEVDVTISPSYGWYTESEAGGSGEASFSSHRHTITTNQQTMKIHNALKVGDKVVLLRQSGGQKYLILDRLVGDT